MSGHYGRARGKYFSTRFELKRQDRDIALFQQVFGTSVQWYFFDPDASRIGDLYDEGTFLAGRRWKGPYRMPVLSANRQEGDGPVGDGGLYVVDQITLELSYDQSRRVGLQPDISQQHEQHLRDRFVYDGRVFEVDDLAIVGQFEQGGRDIIVRVQATQLRADELVNDVDFLGYNVYPAIPHDCSPVVFVYDNVDGYVDGYVDTY